MKQKNKKDRLKRIRYVNISTYLFILYAFSFPFLTMSCTNNVIISYTGYECILGRNFNIHSIHETRPIVIILVPYLILSFAILITFTMKRRFLNVVIFLNIAVIFILMTMAIYVFVKIIKMALLPNSRWSIFHLKDKFECDLNYGFWVVLATIVLLTVYDIKEVHRKKGLILDPQKNGNSA